MDPLTQFLDRVLLHFKLREEGLFTTHAVYPPGLIYVVDIFVGMWM
jgi:hypothetical protein